MSKLAHVLKKSFGNIGHIVKLKIMNSEKSYSDVYRESWNNRTDAHLESDFYDLAVIRAMELRGNTKSH